MPTPLFTLTVSLIINQPCNYTAEQSEPASEEVERKGDGEGEDENFCLNQLLERREKTEGVAESERRRKRRP